MSTRSNIIIITPENQAHQFYHHWDGYLSGVGEELRGYLNDLTVILPDDYKDEGEHDQNDQNELHQDIEFLYIIENGKLYYMEIRESKDYEKLKTYKELVDYICINKHEIDLTKKVTDTGYIYEDNKPEDNKPEDNKPEDYTTTKTEVKTMNYTEEKTRIENEIKALTEKLENLKKQENKEAWKNTLLDRFAKFLEKVDFSKIDEINVDATTEKAEESIQPFYQAHFRLSDFINLQEVLKEIEPAKVETEPTAEEKTEPTKEPEKPENKVVVCSVPKPNETTEEKPVKMKMTLDEFIDSLPEPAQK